MSITASIEQVLSVQTSYTMNFKSLVELLNFIVNNDATLRYLNVSYKITKFTAYYALTITKHLKEVI
jgi:hypothetical protein